MRTRDEIKKEWRKIIQNQQALSHLPDDNSDKRRQLQSVIIQRRKLLKEAFRLAIPLIELKGIEQSILHT